MNPKKVAAIIMAAGFSSRMNDFKPLLPLGKNTVVDCTVSTFKSAGLQHIHVVVGHEKERMISHLIENGLGYIVNDEFEQGMYSSIKAGVSALDECIDAFFIMPVDIPLVKSETIHDLISHFGNRAVDVVYPTFKDRRGHPPLISARLIPAINEFNGEGGLKALLNSAQWRVAHIAVEDPAILEDMDTPLAYEEMVIKLQNRVD